MWSNSSYPYPYLYWSSVSNSTDSVDSISDSTWQSSYVEHSVVDSGEFVFLFLSPIRSSSSVSYSSSDVLVAFSSFVGSSIVER